MSNHTNYRRGEKHRTENGPRHESQNPGKGCNSTHVAKARSDWKKRFHRAQRRTSGKSTGGSFRKGQELEDPTLSIEEDSNE